MFFYSTINLLLFLVNILVICGEENVKVMSNKEAYDDLKRRLSSIKKSCGEVCDQTIEGNIHRGPSLMWFFYTCYLPRQSAKQCTHAGISMTSLLTHNVAHSTRHSFRPKTNNQPIKKFLSLAFSCVKVFKNWTSF